MAASVFSYEDVLGFEDVESETSASTDVKSFFNFFYNVIATNLEKMPEREKYLKKLYGETVFKGYTFKTSLVAPKKGEGFPGLEEDKAINESEVPKDKPLFEGIERCFEYTIPDPAGNLLTLCYVAKGSDEVPIKSRRLDFTNNEGTTRSTLLLTYKLFHALISCCMSFWGFTTGVKPAPLGANAVRACKIPSSSEEKNNWGIHGHAGINFVAKYVYQMKTQKEDQSEPHKKLRLAFLSRMPSMVDFLIFGYRIDQQRIEKTKDKEYSTLRSILQACQFKSEEIEAMRKETAKAMKNWGTLASGAANATAMLFAAEFKKYDTGSTSTSKPANNRKPNEEEIDIEKVLM